MSTILQRKVTIFSGGPPPPRLARLYTWGARYKTNPSLSLVPKFVSLCLSCLIRLYYKVFFFKVPDIVHRPTVAAVARRHCRLPMKNLTPYYSSQFGVSFLFCFDKEARRRLKTRLNGT